MPSEQVSHLLLLTLTCSLVVQGKCYVSSLQWLLEKTIKAWHIISFQKYITIIKVYIIIFRLSENVILCKKQFVMQFYRQNV